MVCYTIGLKHNFRRLTDGLSGFMQTSEVNSSPEYFERSTKIWFIICNKKFIIKNIDLNYKLQNKAFSSTFEPHYTVYQCTLNTLSVRLFKNTADLEHFPKHIFAMHLVQFYLEFTHVIIIVKKINKSTLKKDSTRSVSSCLRQYVA